MAINDKGWLTDAFISLKYSYPIHWGDLYFITKLSIMFNLVAYMFDDKIAL